MWVHLKLYVLNKVGDFPTLLLLPFDLFGFECCKLCF